MDLVKISYQYNKIICVLLCNIKKHYEVYLMCVNSKIEFRPRYCWGEVMHETCQLLVTQSL